MRDYYSREWHKNVTIIVRDAEPIEIKAGASERLYLYSDQAGALYVDRVDRALALLTRTIIAPGTWSEAAAYNEEDAKGAHHG